MQPQPAVVERVGSARWVPVALAGMAAVVVLVAVSARLYTVPGVRGPAWLGLAAGGREPPHPVLLGTAQFAAAGGLTACWLVLCRRADALGPRRLAAVGAAWSLPLIVGPPLRSLDVYSYAAVGRLALLGHDPSRVGPAALPPGPFVAAVDPLWRGTPTPYGPVLVLLLRCCAALGGGSVVLTVLLVRLVACAATAAAVLVVAGLAAPSGRAWAVALVAVNPLVLLDLVSGAHLDVLVGLAAIGVVVLAVRGRPHLAMALAVLAGMGKASAFLLVAFVVLRTLRHTPRAGVVRALLGIAGTGLLTLVACRLLLPDAFGWVRVLGVPARAHGWQAPSEWLAALVQATSPLPVPTSLAVSRGAVLAAGLALALLLLVRGTARPDLGSGLRAVGWALVVVALTGPVLYGWYLVWGLLPLAVVAGPRGRTVLAVLSGALVGAGF